MFKTVIKTIYLFIYIQIDKGFDYVINRYNNLYNFELYKL